MSAPLTRDQLAAILDAHRKWLNDAGGERADLCSANLSGAGFSIRILTFGPFGSQRQITQFFPARDQVLSGCWRGTLEEFKIKVASLFDEGSEYRLLFDSGILLFEAGAKAEAADPKPETVSAE